MEDLQEAGLGTNIHHFFGWAPKKISSIYYSRFAIFVAGFLGEHKEPAAKEQRFGLLDRNLVNLNLIPYHSPGLSGWPRRLNDKQREFMQPYLKTLECMIRNKNWRGRNALFMVGAPWKSVHEEIGFKRSLESFDVNDLVTAYVGTCFGIPAIWFDKFITKGHFGVTNKQLFEAGKKASVCLRQSLLT